MHYPTYGQDDDKKYGFGPGEPITPAVREEAMKAPLFALGARDWFYVAIGVAGTFGVTWAQKKFYPTQY